MDSSRLLLLPSELIHRIAELSSHDSLASLARTHTAFQREAEQALYRTISNPSWKCLQTLATNREKAGFVHFLVMDCHDDHLINNNLFNAPVNMHFLSHFRLRLPRPCERSWIEDLDEILCNNHFRLQTLFCDQAHDLSRIIRSQTDLQILGIYDFYDGKGSFQESLKSLQNDQLHLPIVITLENDRKDSFDSIGIFPAFYPIDRYPAIHQVLVELFQDPFSSYMLTVKCELTIYLFDSCDMPSIHVLTKNLTMASQIISLNFNFENPCEIPSQEIKKIIFSFPYLRELRFSHWSGYSEDGKISEDIKMAHVKDWELACPKLRTVSFMDCSKLCNQFGEWIVSDYY